MTILVTGGTGKTGSVLTRLLSKANKSVLVASRRGTAPTPCKGVKLDWYDAKTFENPFKADSNIDRVYLVVPAGFDHFPAIKSFIDVAVSKGVKRFVLLSASQANIGPPTAMGKVHEYLVNIKVDYAVLRPTWFIQNFSTPFYQTIRERNQIVGVAKDGRVPFVSAEDVAQAAYDALVSNKSPNKDYYIVGPELFTYDEVAELLTEILGRKITYKRISIKEAEKNLVKYGLSQDFAARLVNIESEIGRGVAEAVFYADKSKKFVGKHTVRQYLEANRDTWVN